MNFASHVHKWSRVRPRAPALALGGRTLYDYRTLSTRVAALAGGLSGLGLRPGQHVALLMKNVPQFWECLLACWHAGLVAVPVNARLHPKEVGFILAHAEARLCLATGDLAPTVDPSLVAVVDVESAAYERLFLAQSPALHFSRPDDCAWLFYTSGTTGQPKGAMLSFRNLLTMCHCYGADIDPQPPWTAILHVAPLSHGSGLYGVAHLVKGSCQVIPESGGFDAGEIFDLAAAWPDCVMFAAPTMVRRLTAWPAQTDFAGLKAVIYGGAPMLVEDVKAFIDRFGPRLAQLYGQGESPMTISGMSRDYFADRAHPRWERRLASAGLPQSAVDVQVVDSQGTPVAAGDSGEILVRGDSVMLGYWRNPEATAATVRNGWLWTGDIGRMDDEGFLTILDRSKDVIISGGVNIYPREVEEVLRLHPAVAEVSVIGRPDPEWGEVVVAYLSTTSGQPIAEAELDRLCLQYIARFKRPKAYRFLPEMPKNNTGKILKTALRDEEKLATSRQRPGA